MKRAVWTAIVLLYGPVAFAADDKLPKPLVEGLKFPSAAVVGPGGRVYVSLFQDGQVVIIQDGKAVPFARDLGSPVTGLTAFQEQLFVAAGDRVWRIDAKGKATVFAAPNAFPTPPRNLSGITVDEVGNLYVSDRGTDDKGGAIYRIDPKGKVTVATDGKRTKDLRAPSALMMDGMSFLLVLDSASGELHRVKLADGSSSKVAAGLGSGTGIAWDRYGRLYIGDAKAGKVFVIPRPGDKPVQLAAGFQSIGFIGLGPTTRHILVPDPIAGTLTALPTNVPGAEVDETPLPLQTEVAFPDLKWAGWTGANDKGQLVPLRPIVLTHAGDGSNRVFVATQHGVIHVFPDDQKATKTQVFLDIQDRVIYSDNQNEEGFLGLAFHPNYKKNGEFFVFYTPKKAKLTNVLSRFKVSKDDPNKADPASEEEIFRISRPFWNHDGGTLCFGPDGYLYFTLGDGGSANDPFNNGQNLKTLLGKVLRIDVDRKDAGKKYAVPKDNPFVDKKDAAPEIWAYGLRNIWRMAFDRKTGQLWAADVGQNLYEEIDIITKGGNYGWNLREGLHPFGSNGAAQRSDLIDPIWEYHHDTGKCIVGGHVYRGARLPELDGHYLYADYTNGRLWGLKYDETKKRVVANRPIKDRGFPVLSFGEDEKGDVYVMTFTPSGKGLYRFVKTEAGK